MRAKWLIDKHILKDTRYQDLNHRIEALGYECYLSEYIPFCEKTIEPYPIEDNVVVLGTVGFCRKTRAYNGNYATESNLAYATYISKLRLPFNMFLNGDFIILPYEYLKCEIHRIFDMFGVDSIFMRPNTGTKLFTGFPVNRFTCIYEFDVLEQLHGVSPEDLIIVSTTKSIKSEHRFIVVDHKVVAGSQYQYLGKHVESAEYPDGAHALASKVANVSWQPDPVYTCDVAELADGSFKIIELNSFSCAGWYACDVDTVIHTVSEYSEKEWKELWAI